MARRYLDGQSLRQISEWLTSEAIPAPQPPKDREGKGWTDQAVRRILRNPAMIGQIKVNGRTYMRVEQLIPVEDYKRILQIMSSRPSHRGKREGTTALLTGLLYCPNGHAMYRIAGRVRPSVPDGLYYYCRECPKGERLLIPLQQMDERVSKEVMEHADEPYFITEVTPGDDYADEIEQVKQDIRDLDPEAHDYEPQLATLRGELKRLRALPNKPAEIKHRADGRKIGQVWESLETTAEQRKFLISNEIEKMTARREADGSVSVTGVRIRFPQL